MKEQSRLMPWEICLQDRQILALYCDICQAFLHEPFWRGVGHLSTFGAGEQHQITHGKDHYSRLEPTGYVFNPKLISPI